MAKYLIIMSDDFGMCHSVNQGILQGFNEGIITGSNLMMPCPWIKEAVRLTKYHDLPMGIHLTLTCEWQNMAWKPLTQAKSLTDAFGFMLPDYPALAKQAKQADILAEYHAQLTLCRDMGIEPSHVDSHMLPNRNWFNLERDTHYQCIPWFADLVDQFCAEQGLIYSYQANKQGLKHFASDYSISTNSADDFIAWLQSCSDGMHMATGHLAIANDELRNLTLSNDPASEWAIPVRSSDFSVLRDAKVQQCIKELGFTLINTQQMRDLLQGNAQRNPQKHSLAQPV